MSILPFAVYYLPHRLEIPLTLTTAYQWIIILGISLTSSFLLYQAARFITLSNERIHELEFFSLHDPMTFLANYRAFNQLFLRSFKKARLRRQNLSLILFDIDFFKQINDTYGHQTGNKVLQELSGLLQGFNFPKHSLLARIGGEEFAILLPKTSGNEALAIAEALRLKVRQHQFLQKEAALSLTISAGIATYANTNFSNQDLMKEKADEALYQAKQSGRDQVTCSYFLLMT